MLDLFAFDWLAAVVLLPLLGAAVTFVVPRVAPSTGLAAVSLNAIVVGFVAVATVSGGPLAVKLGGWGAPLGIELRADGLSVVMLVMTALVGLFVSLSALDAFKTSKKGTEAKRMRRYFWPLWLLLLSGLNGAFVTADIFNLYVMIEVIALAAVGLTVLSGRLDAYRAGLDYMLASMLGALLFLMGIGLVYLQAGRLDLGGLSEQVGEPALVVAFALMLIGLAFKTALFPLHFWLPRAHAAATAPASALLSGLVLKASLYIILRLWIDVFSPSEAIGMLLGAMGAGAIVWGSVQALRAKRLKLLVAWSTVAQIGLMCVAFALAGSTGAASAWPGIVLLIVAHALAKAAMFLAAGRIADEVGHDRIRELDRAPVRPKGGPPVRAPSRQGFGMRVLARSVEARGPLCSTLLTTSAPTSAFVHRQIRG